MSQKEFMASTFRALRHIPPTELGFFDVEYAPATKVLSVVVRFSIKMFIDANYIGKWNDQNKADFLSSLQARIDEYWNNRFVIRCTKPGWTDVEAKPVFALRKVSAAFHYSIMVAGTAGTSNTAVRTYQSDHDRKHNPNIGYATAIFGSQAPDRFANATSQRGLIVDALRQPLDVPVGTHQTGGQFSFAAMSLLKTYAENVSYIFATVPTKPTIKITGIGSKTTKDAKRVIQVLRTFGVKNPMRAKSGVGKFGTSAPKGNRVVRIEWDDPGVYDLAFPRDRKAIPLASQATIAHEYGHMLGLPDEYNMLCSQSTDFFAENKLVRSGTEAEVHLRNNPAGSQFAKSDAIANNQKEFIRLCNEAGLVAPPFGRPNISIMSGGSVFKEHHCVTVWDILCRLTARYGLKRSDWRIDLPK